MLNDIDYLIRQIKDRMERTATQEGDGRIVFDGHFALSHVLQLKLELPKTEIGEPMYNWKNQVVDAEKYFIVLTFFYNNLVKHLDYCYWITGETGDDDDLPKIVRNSPFRVHADIVEDLKRYCQSKGQEQIVRSFVMNTDVFTEELEKNLVIKGRPFRLAEGHTWSTRHSENLVASKTFYMPKVLEEAKEANMNDSIDSFESFMIDKKYIEFVHNSAVFSFDIVQGKTMVDLDNMVSTIDDSHYDNPLLKKRLEDN